MWAMTFFIMVYFKQNFNIIIGILPQSVFQNHLSIYGLFLAVCKMQVDLEHIIIHQKYFRAASQD